MAPLFLNMKYKSNKKLKFENNSWLWSGRSAK